MKTGIAPLLNAAEALVRRGETLSISSVAAEAGVSRSTAHRRLGGRRGLLALLAERGELDLPERMRSEPRVRILKAVEAYVLEEGFVGVSLEDIARRAEVGPATLYRTFGDRAGLLRAYTNEYGPNAVAMGFDESGSLRPQLEGLVRRAIPFIRTHQGVLRLLFSDAPEEVALRRAMFRDPASGRRALQRLFSAAMERGELKRGDPMRMVYVLIGSVAAAALAQPDASVDELADALIDGFLQGYATEEVS